MPSVSPGATAALSCSTSLRYRFHAGSRASTSAALNRSPAARAAAVSSSLSVTGTVCNRWQRAGDRLHHHLRVRNGLTRPIRPPYPATAANRLVGRRWMAVALPFVQIFVAEEPETMLLVEVRRLDIAPNTDQFWTIVSRINGPEFMGVLYRAREAIFDSAGISFTIDLLNKFLQFDVTKSWSSADEGELFMGQAPVVGWLRVRRPGSATLRELRSDDVHFMELDHASKPAFIEVGVAYRAGTDVAGRLGELRSLGLIQSEYVIVCSRTGNAVLRTDHPNKLQKMAPDWMKCACGRPLNEERVDQVIMPTDRATALNDKGRWMTTLATAILPKLGISREQVIIDSSPSGTDIVLDLSGDLVMVVLKDREFNLADAYAFNAKVSRIKAAEGVIVSNEGLSGDAKKL